MNVAVIKLGGSLITNKHRRRTVRRKVLERLCAELAEALRRGRRRILLGHGSGSFGHVAAAEFGVHEGRGGAVGAAQTQAVARELHEIVLDALRAAGIPAWSTAPSGAIVARSGKPSTVAVEPVERALDAGLVVVTYGDVVMDRAQGHAICSTETALLAFARKLTARGATLRNTYWFGNTDGILDGSGATLQRLTAKQAGLLAGTVRGSDATDVTGGMRHRVDTARAFARLGAASWILDGRDPGVLEAALAGKFHGGTRIVP